MLPEKTAACRQGAMNKRVWRLVCRYEVIAVETVNLGGEVQTHPLAGSLSDAAPDSRQASWPFSAGAWTWSVGGSRHDREVNAARNILRAGRALTADGGGGR